MNICEVQREPAELLMPAVAEQFWSQLQSLLLLWIVS